MMVTTRTLQVGAALEMLLHTGAIASFADMTRVALASVALDNAESVDEVEAVSAAHPTVMAATVAPRVAA